MVDQLISTTPAAGTALMLGLSGMFVLLLFSKIPFLMKIVAASCIAFALCCLRSPELVSETLGSWERNTSLAILTCSAIALCASFLRFLKAGVIIGLWLVVALIAADRVYPGVIQVNLESLKTAHESGTMQRQIFAFLNVKD